MLKNMDPPLGFGSKCPDRLAYKKLIRMNMPLDNEGKVHFNTTLFALIRENLNIKMRSAEEMDQADIELRETILKVWPFTAKNKIEVLVPTTRGEVEVHLMYLLIDYLCMPLVLYVFLNSQCPLKLKISGKGS